VARAAAHTLRAAIRLGAKRCVPCTYRCVRVSGRYKGLGTAAFLAWLGIAKAKQWVSTPAWGWERASINEVLRSVVRCGCPSATIGPGMCSRPSCLARQRARHPSDRSTSMALYVGWGNQANLSLLRRVICGRLIAGVALLDKRDLDCFARCFLNLLGQFSNLRPILLIGWCDQQRQQLAQRVDRQLDFAATPSFVAVIAGARSTLGRGLQRAAVEDCHTRLRRQSRGC
jgi:hypothetical protein